MNCVLVERGALVPKSVKPSEALLHQLSGYCEAEEIALAMLGSDDIGVCILVLGDPAKVSVNEASVIAAHMLLSGVVSGKFVEENDQKVEEETKTIPKEIMN